MKLSTMAASFRGQMEDNAVAELSFEEQFGLLVDAEWISRKNNRLKRLIRKADYVFPGASLEDIEYHSDRKLDKAMITRPGTCSYIGDCRNIIVLGATGSGKTYLTHVFGITANRNFYTVRYVRLPELLAELALARAEGTYRKVLKQYRQVKLLILDE